MDRRSSWGFFGRSFQADLHLVHQIVAGAEQIEPSAADPRDFGIGRGGAHLHPLHLLHDLDHLQLLGRPFRLHAGDLLDVVEDALHLVEVLGGPAGRLLHGLIEGEGPVLDMLAHLGDLVLGDIHGLLDEILARHPALLQHLDVGVGLRVPARRRRDEGPRRVDRTWSTSKARENLHVGLFQGLLEVPVKLRHPAGAAELCEDFTGLFLRPGEDAHVEVHGGFHRGAACLVLDDLDELEHLGGIAAHSSPSPCRSPGG